MARFAKGRRALAISDRSGVAFPYNEMVKEWNGSFVHNSEFEAKQPQLEPHPVGADPQGLMNARPARIEFPTAALLRKENPFICADVDGNANIQVNQKGTGLVNGDYVRFGEVKAPILFGNTYTIGEVEQAFTLTNDITDTQNTINVTMTNYTFNIQSVLPLPGFIVIEKINSVTGRYENEVISFTGLTGNNLLGQLTGCVRGVSAPFRGVTPPATTASAHLAGATVLGSRPVTMIQTTVTNAANTVVTEENSFLARVVNGATWNSTGSGGGFPCTYGPLNDRA
jgi:hypothetical protein